MLSDKKQKAVDLLFEFTEAEAAAKLRINRTILREWMNELEFQQAIGEEIRANRQASVRKLSRLYLDACKEMNEIIHEKEDKNRHRVIVDILKVSGLLKASTVEDSAGGLNSVQALVAKLADEDEESEDDSDGEMG